MFFKQFKHRGIYLKTYFKIVNPEIERNAKIVNPKNLLLAMVIDDIKHIRELRYRQILKAR